MQQLFEVCFDIYHLAAISASVYISQRSVGRQFHLLAHKYLHSLSHCLLFLVYLNTAERHNLYEFLSIASNFWKDTFILTAILVDETNRRL
jgi:hypothetical protein